MNWSGLPPLSSLRAFAAYAETGSVVAAGAALNVTHAAISQHLRALETHLGVALVVRSGRALSLTPEGAQLARSLGQAFAQMAGAVESLSQSADARPLNIATTPSFAAYWLMPRLSAFRARYPDLDLLLNPSVALTNPEPGGVDLAIRYGTGHWAGLEAELLMSAPVVVVAAPSLLDGRTIREPADLLSFPWLQESGNHEASTWLERQGVTQARVRGMTQLPGHLMLEGARAGQGVGVTTELFAADDLASGRLTLLFREEAARGYYLVTAPGVMRPALRHFVSWLRSVVRKT